MEIEKSETSPRKIEANRANALRSTGPKTAAGKSVVRGNALKHGLFSREVLIPGESESDLMELRNWHYDTLKPVGAIECFLVDRIILSVWRLHRLARLESGVLTWTYYDDLAASATHRALSLGDMQQLTNKAERRRLLAQAENASAQKESELASWGGAFIRDSREADAFAKLSRYETSLERGFYRAFHELQRLQAARAGRDVPLPVAADVDLTVTRIEGLPRQGDLEVSLSREVNPNLS